MMEFTHVIRDKLGLHARPVTQIALVTRDHQSTVQVACGNSTAAGDDLMALMGLDARQGDELTVRVDGPDEEATAAALKDVLP